MGFLLSIFYAIVEFAWSFSRAYIGFKGFMTTLMLIALPIVLNNFFGKFLEKIMMKVTDTVSTDTSTIESITYNFTGLAAFFINHLRIADALSIVFSAIAIRVTLSMIPFSKL